MTTTPYSPHGAVSSRERVIAFLGRMADDLAVFDATQAIPRTHPNPRVAREHIVRCIVIRARTTLRRRGVDLNVAAAIAQITPADAERLHARYLHTRDTHTHTTR
jgi:hypothetical protein